MGLPTSHFYYIVIESDTDAAVGARSECFGVNLGEEPLRRDIREVRAVSCVV